ncbi:uncharacterized protein M6B38_254260 [Iris pallida]|uniref:DM2 domain-containing protein n=1 Tax=Iris pallida TaxID=29817 RepID=A0AAX6IH97_IRIPA|nr:uncharacterized protein M6B38_254260 [Iris pallida]
MVPLPSDQEIASCVESLLRQQSSDPANAGAAISLTTVVHHVQSKLGGVDLSHKAAFIRDQIDLLLGPPRAPLPFRPPFIPHQFLYHHPFPPHQTAPPQQLPTHLLHPHHHLPMSTAVASAGVGSVPMSPEASSSSSSSAASPFAQFGTHHELAFRYPVPSPPPPIQPQQPGLPIGSALAPKENAPVAAKRRGGPGGLSKICGVSPELQVIVGEPAMPRTQIVKQLWAYIRKKQSPRSK